MNGDGRKQIEAYRSGFHDGAEHPAITVNFGLTPRQIGLFLASIPATIAGLGITGLFFMPAKQEDMAAVQRDVVAVRETVIGLQGEVKATKESADRMAGSLDALHNSIAHLQGSVDRRAAGEAREVTTARAKGVRSESAARTAR